jgi:hypothetical protein
MTEHLLNKEGVGGSSLPEGSAKFLLISPFRMSLTRPVAASTSTERPPPAAGRFREAWPCDFGGLGDGVHPRQPPQVHRLR